MDLNRMLIELREYLEKEGITQVDIAKDLGVTKMYVNALMTGRRPFGKKQALKWEEIYGFNSGWLLTGEGQMLKGAAGQVSFGDGSPNLNGSHNSVGDPAALGKALDSLDTALAELAAQRRLTEKAQEQIDRLLSIIESLRQP